MGISAQGFLGKEDMKLFKKLWSTFDGLKTKIGVLGAFVTSIFAGQPLLADAWKDVMTAPDTSNVLMLVFQVLAATGVIHGGYKIVKGDE